MDMIRHDHRDIQPDSMQMFEHYGPKSDRSCSRWQSPPLICRPRYEERPVVSNEMWESAMIEDARRYVHRPRLSLGRFAGRNNLRLGEKRARTRVSVPHFFC